MYDILKKICYNIKGKEEKMNNKKQVVGTLFFKDGKLLIDKPRKRSTYQMIGGSVEEGEEIRSAAIRECHEELGTNAIFDENKITFLMEFDEIATSNGLPIHMNIFIYNATLSGTLTTSEEIESFMWFGKDDDTSILSNTLKNEIVPYCKEKKLIK